MELDLYPHFQQEENSHHLEPKITIIIVIVQYVDRLGLVLIVKINYISLVMHLIINPKIETILAAKLSN